jgi:spore coat protein CotH
MQWQLIPETTMHAIDINALLTMIAINKLTDRTRADPEMTGNGHNYFFPNVKMINAAVKTHTRRCLRS